MALARIIASPGLEQVLDRLTPTEVLRLCEVSVSYRFACSDAYWYGRAQRLLAPNLTPNPRLNSWQQYLDWYHQCQADSKDKPLTISCGRLIGRRGNIEEIVTYLQRDGNPQDVAYGAASVGNDNIIERLLRYYPRFRTNIARNVFRGAGAGDEILWLFDWFHRYQDSSAEVFTISFQHAMRLFLDEALRTGSIKASEVHPLTLNNSPATAAFLAGRGWDVPVEFEVEITASPIGIAIRNEDVAGLRQLYQQSQDSDRELLIQFLQDQASPQLVQQILRAGWLDTTKSSPDQLSDVDTLLSGLLVKQPEVFVTTINWLRQPTQAGLHQPNYQRLRAAALASNDYGLLKWADTIPVE